MSATFWFGWRMAASGAVLAIGAWAFLQVHTPEAGKDVEGAMAALALLVGAVTIAVGILTVIWTA